MVHVGVLGDASGKGLDKGRQRHGRGEGVKDSHFSDSVWFVVSWKSG